MHMKVFPLFCFSVYDDPDTRTGRMCGFRIGLPGIPVMVEVDGGTTVSVWIERHGGGYDVWKGSVYVPKGEHVTYTAKLYRTEDRVRSTGYLSVFSSVEGVEVHLDNGFIGMITNGTRWSGMR